MFAAAFQNLIAPTKPMSWTEAILLSSVAIVAALPATAGLYLVKSALGINLMDGPSPLHDLLYQLIA
jgi:hypothetical protein